MSDAPQIDVLQHNRESWNKYVAEGNRWSTPVAVEEVTQARNGNIRILLTPNRPVPKEWLGNLAGSKVLCLASAGGQQAPLLAAAGAEVTSYDNSDAQLKQDEFVAEREGLKIKTIQGDMADLSRLGDAEFDLIVNVVSNVFVPHLKPIWEECARVLKPGGRLIVGFMNPAYYLFDHEEAEQTGEYVVRFRAPYADLTHFSAERIERMRQQREAFEYGHSLDTQIGDQLKAGFVLCDLYEDDWDEQSTPFNKFGNMFVATLSRKISLEE
ncbi:MAG: class I SAM-dependent methyltransferase [Planctomycetaceae bacterium]